MTNPDRAHRVAELLEVAHLHVESSLIQPCQPDGAPGNLASAPNYASGCPTLRPASANQPLGPCWHQSHVGLVFSTWRPTARAHFSMRSRKRERLASAPTASRSAARLPLYLVVMVSTVSTEH